MLSDERSPQNRAQSEEEEEFRDIHTLTPPPTRRSDWQAGPTSRHTSTASLGSGVDPAILAEQLTIVNRELAMIQESRENNNGSVAEYDSNHGRIGDFGFEETNPLALVPDANPIPSPQNTNNTSGEAVSDAADAGEEVSVTRVRREETELKITAWQTAEVAKINNRFKREEVVINGWENAQAEKAAAWLKKIERKLEKERARATEKTENEVARARRKAEEKRASADAKRGTKIAKILDMAHFMRAVGRAPSKRSVF